MVLVIGFQLLGKHRSSLSQTFGALPSVVALVEQRIQFKISDHMLKITYGTGISKQIKLLCARHVW